MRIDRMEDPGLGPVYRFQSTINTAHSDKDEVIAIYKPFDDEWFVNYMHKHKPIMAYYIDMLKPYPVVATLTFEEVQP